MADASIWRGRRVLVTGHTGFKGGWLCVWLQSMGAKVAGYALDPPTDPSLFEDARVAAASRMSPRVSTRPSAMPASSKRLGVVGGSSA